jgi:hypothetical protein
MLLLTEASCLRIAQQVKLKTLLPKMMLKMMMNTIMTLKKTLEEMISLKSSAVLSIEKIRKQ